MGPAGTERFGSVCRSEAKTKETMSGGRRRDGGRRRGGNSITAVTPSFFPPVPTMSAFK